MNKSKLVVLGLLNESAKHGYQIINDIKDRSMDRWAKINTATIYNTLSKLEEKGFIVAETKKEGKFPERKEYSLTGPGRKETEKLIKKCLANVVPDNCVEFLLAVGFSNLLDQDDVRKILSEREIAVQKIIKEVSAIKGQHARQIPYSWLYIIEHTLNSLELHSEELLILMKNLGPGNRVNGKGGKI
jgi:DNA-binding PadR family transcriptional regulator